MPTVPPPLLVLLVKRVQGATSTGQSSSRAV